MSKYIMVFLVVLLAVFGIYSYRVDIAAAVNDKNSEYSSYLSAAAHDAAKVIADKADSNSRTGTLVAMDSETDRQEVANVFFNSLAMDFGYRTNEDMQKLHIYVPVLCLVDTNGYYICYNAQHSGGGSVKVDSLITPINTWTRKTEHYIIRYYLGNNVDVICMDPDSDYYNRQFSGNYRDVYVNFEYPKELAEVGMSSTMNGYAALSGEYIYTDNELNMYSIGGGTSTFKGTETALAVQEKAKAQAGAYDTQKDYVFNLYKRDTIINELNEKIEYYINQHNRVANAYHVDYKFKMPKTTADDWTRMVQRPTAIGFLQGIRVATSYDYLNIYAIGGGDISKVRGVVYKVGADGKGKYVYTDATNRLDELGDTDADGYMMGGRSVTERGNEVVVVKPDADGYTKDSVVTGKYYHHHSGNSLFGGGCYTIPLYHVHTDACYEMEEHHHVNSKNQLAYQIKAAGAHTGTTEGDLKAGEAWVSANSYITTLENGLTETVKDVKEVKITKKGKQKIVNRQVIVTPQTNDKGCYTIPIAHEHVDACYKEKIHAHSYFVPGPGGGHNWDDRVEVKTSATTVMFDLVDILDSDGYIYCDFDRNGVLDDSERKWLGCFGGLFPHVHTTACVTSKDVAGSDVVEIFHKHLEPNIHYVTTDETDSSVGLQKEYYSDSSNMVYTTPEDGDYLIEAWGAQNEATAGGQGGYAALKTHLAAGTNLYVHVDESGFHDTAGYGIYATFVGITPTGNPDTNELESDRTLYVAASSGNGTKGGFVLGYDKDPSVGAIEHHVNNGRGKVRISQMGKILTREEAVSHNAKPLYVDCDVEGPDGAGGVQKCCYVAVYTTQAGARDGLINEFAEALKQEVDNGNTTRMENLLKNGDIRLSSDEGFSFPGLVYLGMRKVCGMETNKVIGTKPIVTSTTEYGYGCGKVYEGIYLNCGFENGDIQSKKLICGRVSIDDAENSKKLHKADSTITKLDPTIDYWKLSCDHIEGKQYKKSEDPICGKEGTLVGYGVSCGKEEGQEISYAEYMNGG